MAGSAAAARHGTSCWRAAERPCGRRQHGGSGTPACEGGSQRLRWLVPCCVQDNSGRVHFEDFRNMAETFGMQLDDDSLMALYFVYDPEVKG